MSSENPIDLAKRIVEHGWDGATKSPGEAAEVLAKALVRHADALAAIESHIRQYVGSDAPRAGLVALDRIERELLVLRGEVPADHDKLRARNNEKIEALRNTLAALHLIPGELTGGVMTHSGSGRVIGSHLIEDVLAAARDVVES